MTSNENAALAELRDGPLYRFADWPNPAVPNGRIGVYTVWHGDQLVSVGMAGRAIGSSPDTSWPATARLTGLRSRPASHASGRRSGDQFCVYVFDAWSCPGSGTRRFKTPPEASSPWTAHPGRAGRSAGWVQLCSGVHSDISQRRLAEQLRYPAADMRVGAVAAEDHRADRVRSMDAMSWEALRKAR